MAYTNKFILKADASQLNDEIDRLVKDYTASMDAMGAATRELSVKEGELAVAEDALTHSLKKKQEAAKKTDTKTAAKAYKEEIALAKQKVAILKREVATLSKREKAEATNAKNIQTNITKKKQELALNKEMEASINKLNESTSINAMLTDRDSIAKQTNTTATTLNTAAQTKASMARNKTATATTKSTQAEKAYANGLNDISNNLVRHIRHLESYLVAVYGLKKAYDVTLGRGHEFNKIIESETIGLKLLISQHLEHNNVLGEAVTAQDRYTYAQNEANKAMEIARKVNVETPHSFKETFQIFKLLTPQVLAYGGSLEQVGETTKRMSIIAASMGIEFQQFLKTVDSALSGEMKESALKRALEQFGVSNEAIKEVKKRNGDVVGFIIDGMEQAKTAGVDIFNSWQGAVGQFTNEWDSLFGELQKPLFEGMKGDIKEFTKFIKDNRQGILDLAETIEFWGKRLITIASAFALLKVSTLGYAKILELFRKEVVVGNAAIGYSTRTASLSIKEMAASFKGLAASAAPLAVLYAAFEAYNYILKQTEDRLDSVAETTKKTTWELALLGEQTFKNSQKSKLIEYEKTTEKIIELKDALDYLNGGDNGTVIDLVSSVGVIDATTKSTEELIAAIKEKIEKEKKYRTALVDSYSAANKVTDEQRSYARASKDLSKLLSENSAELSKQKAIINLNSDKESEAVVTAQKKVVELEKQKQALLDEKKKLDLLLQSVGLTVIAYKEMGRSIDEDTAKLEKMLKVAYSMSKALVQQDLLLGKINDREALNRNTVIEVENIKKKGLKGKEETLAYLELTNKYIKETAALDKKAADDKLAAEKKHNAVLLENLNVHGKTNEALALQIQQIENSSLSEIDKQLKIDSLKTKAANDAEKAAKLAEKSNTKSAGSARKTANELKKQEKELKGIYKAYLRLTNQTEKLTELNVDEAMKDMIKLYDAGIIKAEELSEVYNKLLEGGNEGANRFASSFSSAFDDMLHGDLASSFTNFFDSIGNTLVSKFVKDTSKSLSGMLDDLLGGLGSFASFGVGAALSLAGTLLDSLFSKENTQTTKEYLDERGFVEDPQSESIINILDSMDWTLSRDLTYSKGIFDNISALVEQSGKAAVGIVGNIQAPVNKTWESGIFGIHTETLKTISTSIELGLKDIGEFFGQVNEDFEKTKTHVFSADSVHRWTESTAFAPEVRDQLALAYQNGFDALFETAGALGVENLDKSMKNAIAKLTIDELNITGKTDEEIAALVNGKISKDLDQVTKALIGWVSAFTVGSEGLFETATRVTYEGELIQKAFGQLGYSFSSLTQQTVIMSQAFIDASNGIDSALANINGYIDNFYTDAEKQSLRAAQINTAYTEESYKQRVKDLTKAASAGDAVSAQALADLLRLQKIYAEYFDYIATMEQKALDEKLAREEEAKQKAEEALNKRIALMEEELSFNEEILSKIEDAYSGALSYLNSLEKAAYFDAMARQSLESGNTQGYFDNLYKQLEYEKKMSTSREDYAVKFDSYIYALKEAEPEKTADDVVETLEVLIEQNKRIGTAIVKASYQAPIT